MALQGTLDTFALPDVLRLLASTKKTGRLLVSGNRGNGSVWVDAGGVVGSEATGTMDDSTPVDVLFELLRYTEGAFTFEAGSAPDAPTASRAVEPLLVDAERLLVEWREIEAVVPSMDAWVSLAPEIEGDEILVAAERWRAIVAIGSGTSVSGLANSLHLGELDVCRRVKELVELDLATVTTTPMPTLAPLEETMVTAAESEPVPSGASWDPFSIEIPGVAPMGAAVEPEADPTSAAVADDVEPPVAAEPDVLSVVDADDDAGADEVAKQLASLSPKAARAVAAAAEAESAEERDAALAEADDDEEPINRGLLLKFLSSVKS